MSLSDKRKDLRWQIDKRKEKKVMSLLLDEVEKQDREFIEKLKADLEEQSKHKVGHSKGTCYFCDMMKRIDKLAGDDLI